MNKVILMGRLTQEPQVNRGENSVVARYTLAEPRPRQVEGESNADFVSCVVFGRAAEFAENYLHQGTKLVVSGRIQTGSYTNKEGQKVYTTDVAIESQEFAESKKTETNTSAAGVDEEEELPFS